MSTEVVEQKLAPIEEQPEEKKNTFADDIKDVYDTLALVNCSKAKWYTDAYLEDDVKDLLQSYEEEIAPLDDTDPVKIEMLHIMAYLGIEIAKPEKDDDEEPDDSELVAEG